MGSRRVIHRGRVGEFGIDTVTLPNGVTVDLEVLHHPGAAAVVPLHADGSVTLIRQFRHAAGGTIWEIPAGKLEPGEDPLLCAQRELEEEAGVSSGVLRHLTTILTTPGFTDEVIHLYVATELGEVPSRLEADEVIERHRIPGPEVIAMIRRGEITDAKSIVGLLLALT
ncbi:ADP-ribose pyrophosphatase [Deltaproteobacteria bacterium]|nr:ADP-ribose pyrophosphatase [Deltaproteobacteria bacterium]